MEVLIAKIEKAALECGTILNLREFAWYNGYYTKHEIIDDEGNILDYEWVITRQSLQEIADIFTDGFDVMNW